MKKMKSVIAMLCVISMMFSLVVVPAAATDISAEKNEQVKTYDWDYDLAMERGYLTHEDALPDGIVLNEDEIFIPVEVPSPFHAEAIAGLEAHRKKGVNMMGARNNPLSDPWDYYTWEYLGVIRSDTLFDAIIDAGGSLVLSTMFSVFGVHWALSFLYSLAELTAAAVNYVESYGKLIGYYNKFMYTAEDVYDIPYINYAITDFYADASRTSDHYIGTGRSWEFAVAP